MDGNRLPGLRPYAGELGGWLSTHRYPWLRLREFLPTALRCPTGIQFFRVISMRKSFDHFRSTVYIPSTCLVFGNFADTGKITQIFISADVSDFSLQFVTDCYPPEKHSFFFLNIFVAVGPKSLDILNRHITTVR